MHFYIRLNTKPINIEHYLIIYYDYLIDMRNIKKAWIWTVNTEHSLQCTFSCFVVVRSLIFEYFILLQLPIFHIRALLLRFASNICCCCLLCIQGHQASPITKIIRCSKSKSNYFCGCCCCYFCSLKQSGRHSPHSRQIEIKLVNSINAKHLFKCFFLSYYVPIFSNLCLSDRDCYRLIVNCYHSHQFRL